MLSAGRNMEALLEKRKQEGLYRTLHQASNLVDFCSNDYLGFARSSQLAERAKQISSADFTRINGSTGSRLIRGNTQYAEELEQIIASYHHASAALLFNSGYDANIGFFSSVPQRGDTILYDKLIHASIRDGIRLSNAKAFAFGHNNLDDLQQYNSKVSGNVFVAIESVYSMDGDIAPLEQIAELCRTNGWHLVVDEAHAIGVFGRKGEGLIVEGLEESCFARIYTYGKAMGAHGAAILGSSVLRDYLLNFARSFIYTTALPPHVHALIKAGYSMLEEDSSQRAQLHENIAYLNRKKPQHLRFIKGESAIQSLIIGGNENTRSMALKFQQAGLDIRAILSPTVPEGEERLRICLHAFNTGQEIDRLLEILHELPIIRV